MPLFRLVTGAMILCCAGAAAANVANIAPAHDNTLYGNPDGEASNGAGQYFFAGVNREGEIRRGLISFDVAGALPAGATITAATLTLHMSRTVSGPQDISLFPLLASWGEAGSVGAGQEGDGGPPQPGDATWIHRFYDTQMWGAAGGDFASVSSATTSVADIGFYSWSSPQVLADVQSWLADPAGNFGWLLRGNEDTSYTTKRFDTRENTTPADRPVLELTYVPEPGPGLSVVFLALAGVWRRGGRG
jgi:hypothetical protein